MEFTFGPMKETEARAIAAWRYGGEYSFYDGDAAGSELDIQDMLDGSYFSATDEEGELVGFFCVGLAAQVPSGWRYGLYEEEALDVGLGLRPDLTGKGLGPSFVNAGLDFLRGRFSPPAFRLVVATFNRRAIRVYEKVGFSPVTVFVSWSPALEVEFLLMTRQEALRPAPALIGIQ